MRALLEMVIGIAANNWAAQLDDNRRLEALSAVPANQRIERSNTLMAKKGTSFVQCSR